VKSNFYRDLQIILQSVPFLFILSPRDILLLAEYASEFSAVQLPKK
jgi:hypothetical protein